MKCYASFRLWDNYFKAPFYSPCDYHVFNEKMCEKSTRDSVDLRTKYTDITFQIPSGHSTQYFIVSSVPRSFCAAQIYLCKLIHIDLF